MLTPWIVAVGVVAAAVADGPLSVRRTQEPVSSRIAPAVAAGLSSEAYIVAAGDKTLAKFWFRKSIPVAANAKLAYASLPEGTLIGAVEIIAEDWTDFRKQALTPGVYTLRLGLQPKDGNHMGVSPASEFLCLSSAAKDGKLDPLEHKPLMNLSKTALDTGHPVVWFLNAFGDSAAEKFPSVVQNQLMHTVLQVKLKAATPDGKTADFPFGIVVVGQTTADG